MNKDFNINGDLDRRAFLDKAGNAANKEVEKELGVGEVSSFQKIFGTTLDNVDKLSNNKLGFIYTVNDLVESARFKVEKQNDEKKNNPIAFIARQFSEKSKMTADGFKLDNSDLYPN